jgi:hypothetical protein
VVSRAWRTETTEKELSTAAALCKLVYMIEHSEQPVTTPIRAALCQAIAEGRATYKGLERETGVLRQSLMRFARGGRALRGDAYDRLASYFGLHLRRANRRKGTP